MNSLRTIAAAPDGLAAGDWQPALTMQARPARKTMVGRGADVVDMRGC